MSQKKRLVRTSNLFGTVAIATVLGIAGIAGGIQCNTITLAGGILMGVPVMVTGLVATAIHVAANNKLQTK